MIKIENLSKKYSLGKDNFVQALDNVSLEFKTGSMNALIGPSGSGKSTMLNILGGLDRDYTGTVNVLGEDLKNINANKYRREYVQTIFQQFYLVPSLDVVENMTLAIKFGNQYSGKELKERADYILNKVGLYERRDHKPSELSGGQIQRVAIARAIITNPKILLADEPTGNLDSKTGDEIMDLLFEINREEKNTVIIITHNVEIIKDIKSRVHLKDGKVVSSH